MPGLTFVPVSLSAPATDRETEGGRERDPHALPTFTDASLHEPTSPVLYLPPLLSALPRHITNTNAKEASAGNHEFYNQYYDRTTSHPTGLDIPKLPPHPDRLHPTATRLPDIDPASLALHRALHFLKPRDGFAKLPYAEAFNWGEIGAAYRSDGVPRGEIEREWYIVAFRSRRREGSDSAPLYEADRLAHEEAVQNGGLLMYWYGVPDPKTGDNLATCIWQSRAHAVAANSRPHHIKAMRLAAASFAHYTLERYVLRKWKGEPKFEIVPYTNGEVGW